MNLLPVTAASSSVIPGPQPLATGESPPFAQLLDSAIASAMAQQDASQAGVQALLTGESDNLQSVVLGAAKADVSLQLLLGVRDRLVSAHQEIMRMQI
jgi:flagellar hook-basal body complex protein FliE